MQPWNAPPREPQPRGPAPLPTAEEAAHVPAQALPVPDPQWEDSVEPIESGKKRKGIPKQRRLSPLMLVLLVLLFIVAVAAAAMFLVPGLLPGLQPRANAPAEHPRLPARRAPAAAMAGVARPYSVFVKAFEGDRGHQAAIELAQRVEREFPGTVAYVTPEETNGGLYYKVLAGMLDDTVQAAQLRAQLVAKNLANPEDVGGPAALIQPRPWAFELGAHPTRDAADAQAQTLATRGIDAYTVPVPRTDGSEAWTLYAGAYSDSARAAPMKKTLESAGLQPRLVRRVGRAPAISK